MGPFYRRSPRLVAYWRGERFVLHPYRNSPALEAAPELVQVLDAFSSWTSAITYQKALGIGSQTARRTLDRLVDAGILERSAAPRSPRNQHSAWETWDIAASFLHFSTRDRAFLSHARAKKQMAARSRQVAPPSALKEYVGHPRIALPAPNRRSQFHEVLENRRTWRRFGTHPLPLGDLSAVLHASFAVQRWVDLGALGRVMLRSSPSGGARHPIEAYLLARRVEGLRPGAYYYAPDTHDLVELHRTRISSGTIAKMVGGQPWYRGASALVVLTAVLARKSWAYRSARAYRSLLLEAGHFCQTFCLAATERGLAPFCTGAFSETMIEQALGLDPDVEPVLYVGGAGTRPRGVRWAPLPAGETGLGD